MAVTWGLICVLIVVLGFLAKYWKPSTFPGPPGLPFVGHAFSMLGVTSEEIIPILMKYFNKYGDIFELRLFNRKYVIITEPELVKPLLSSSTHITKGRFEYSFFRPLFSDGLIVSDGDKWRSRRKLLTPSFHFKILETSIETAGRHAEEYVSNLLASKGKPTEIEDMIYLLTLKIIGETAMGVKLNTGNKQQNEYIKASKICHDGIVNRYLRFWLYPDIIYHLSTAGKIFFKNVDIIHNLANQIIRNRREQLIAEKTGFENRGSTKKEKKAFLDTLLELDDANSGLFTDSDIREEVDTFMVAGHNPSAAALKFLHFILANHPDVQEKVYNEQMEIFSNDRRMATAQDLQKMIYLEMVIKETLRLYPSVPLNSRFLNEDLQIAENIVVPAGCTIAVFNHAVHRSKKHWTNPEEFIPERFAPGIERHPFSFIPFSAGPRSCIGQKYAMMELKTIMSTVIRHCRLEPVTTSVSLSYSITLQPAEPIIVKVFSRNETGRTIMF